MKAFITGIGGQDGSYLAEHLLSLGYEVHGIIRRNSVTEHQQSRIESVKSKMHIYYGDLLDQSSIEHLLDKIQPDEIYNIAAQSHVRVSYDIPQFTVQTNALGVLSVLEAYRRSCPEAKFYQASSSEMFGSSVDADGFQRETTSMTPVSPYGCSKVFGYNIVRNYRNAYKLHASNGILFNHESPRRGSNFVTNKVVKTAVQIKLGLVKDQTTASANGIYLCASGSWTRTTDADTYAELVAAYTFVEGGTVNGNNGFICTIAAGGTLGTTAITWATTSRSLTMCAWTTSPMSRMRNRARFEH